MSSIRLLLCLGMVFLLHEVAAFDYKDALTKSLLFYEGQRSGKLPGKQRIIWRADSGLRDGSDSGIDLVGGYYDAGDNVKYGFPMAYTITMLAWSVVEFEAQLAAKNELENAREAVKWGTDYLIKSHPQSDVLYAEVGDGDSDHACWQRPEDMTTPRTTYKIDSGHPGADLAAQTAAAMAAASVVFSKVDHGYATTLLDHAKQLFDFADKHPGLYSDSIPVAQIFYGSSDAKDELLLAATWLYRATNDEAYIHYIDAYDGTGWIRSMFSWDDKYVGVQLLMAKMVLDGKLSDQGKWHDYKTALEEFICNCLQKGQNNVKRSPGGLNWWDPWNNLQYTTSASFVATVYAQYLGAASATMTCHNGDNVGPDGLVAFAKSQVDYILGANPKGMSYMVGFGTNYPTRVHHRGSSIESIRKDPKPVECKEGYNVWFNRDAPNPNVLEGAILGGPYVTDEYRDARDNFQQAEPAIANVAPLVGVLAKLA